MVLFPLPRIPAQGAVLENKKGDSRNGYPLEMGTKKAKEPLYQSEALLPVIFSIIVLAIYPRRQDLPYIKPSNYRLVFILYPVKRFIGSPHPAGTTACGLAHKTACRGILKTRQSLTRE
jgi:hypothetical protein